jgi:glucose-1-phosphatase
MRFDASGIKNIFFDLGNVLLNLDFDASIEAFRKLGMDEQVVDKQQAYADPVFYELETGRTTPAKFRERIRQIVNNPDATDQQIDDAWCAMILDIPARRVEVIQKLSKKYKVYLFSNTNQIHISRLHSEFKAAHGIEFPSLFVKDYYSHEINERKPDLSSYRKVIELAGVEASQSLFIDDLEKNIHGAQQAGMKTIWLNHGEEIGDVLSQNGNFF